MKRRNEARLERELVAARYTASGLKRPLLVYLIDMAIAEFATPAAESSRVAGRQPIVTEGAAELEQATATELN